MPRGGTNPAQRAHIEAIVREVLAELAAGGFPESPSAVQGAGHKATESDNHGDLVVASKVISTKELENRLEGVRRVVVPRGAVVTPAARDLLRERAVAITSKKCNCTNDGVRGEVVVAMADVRVEPRGIVAAIANAGYHMTRLPDAGLLDTIQTLCTHAAHENRRGLLVTNSSAAALCLANRQRGVRAALGATPAAVSAAVRSIGPNVLIVDPDDCAAATLGECVTIWLHSDGKCLPELRQQLG